jgi:hypothetical protein
MNKVIATIPASISWQQVTQANEVPIGPAHNRSLLWATTSIYTPTGNADQQAGPALFDLILKFSVKLGSPVVVQANQA